MNSRIATCLTMVALTVPIGGCGTYEAYDKYKRLYEESQKEVEILKARVAKSEQATKDEREAIRMIYTVD